jgi:subtilase family serine protease
MNTAWRDARRWWALTCSVGLAGSFLVAAAGPAAASALARRANLKQSEVPALERSHRLGGVAATSQVSFDLVLSLSHAAAAQGFVRTVSTPGSRLFHHYLSDAQWESRFGPTHAEVARAASWLRAQGFTVGRIPGDRLFVPARGSALSVGRAFGVALGYYQVEGKRVRLANGTLSIPSSLASTISGVVGVNQYLASTSLAMADSAAAGPPAAAGQEPAPPAGFRNPAPCSAFWGQKSDTADSGSLYQPYKAPLPYDICGYRPAQLRGAYQIAKPVAAGTNGSGETIAIVDAYDSPTLMADAQKYSKLNDPTSQMTAAQFTNLAPAMVDDAVACGGSNWLAEQSLDLESAHAMAPEAHIIYVGAQDCQDASLLAALQTAVTSGASVVSDSWGNIAGDLFTDAGTKTAYDNTLLLAAATGVSVLFSAGDTGDNFANLGMTVPNYPAASPFATAVGGTMLEVNPHNARLAEYGWSAARQLLCTPAKTSCGAATNPIGTLGWQSGGGGGTSYTYPQPYYQAGVVPNALALRNQALFGPQPMRVLPDISMDADPQSGMLIGLTQTFPHSVHYGQFRAGGTSLSSPLLAGIIADANQAAKTPLGFLDPIIYETFTRTPAAFADIGAPANPDAAAVIRVDYADAIDATRGYILSLRAIGYEGPEIFCDGTGNCATRNVSLTAAPGFDSSTGLGTVGSRFITTLGKF